MAIVKPQIKHKSLLIFGNIYGAFTLDVKSVWNENLGGILGGTQC